MRQDQVDRRQASADRHDAVLNRWPRRGDAFAAELRTVTDEPIRLTAELPPGLSRSTEWSRTFRWLGDAYYDLADARDRALLARGRRAYERAFELLEGLDEPVERAKLLVNSANTLRMLGGLDDRALLDETLRRYETARALFAAHDPSRVAVVDDLIGSLTSMLGLMDTQASLGAIEMPDPEQATQADLDRLRATLSQAGKATMTQAQQGQRALERLGQRAKVATDKSELQATLSEMSALIEQSPDDNTMALFDLLRQRFEQDVSGGKVSPDRAATLTGILEDMSGVLQNPSDDLESLMSQRQAFDRLMARVTDLKGSSHGLPQPPKGSRAATLAVRWTTVSRSLKVLANRRNLADGVRDALMDLIAKAGKLNREIFAAGANDAHAATLERERLRSLALEARQHVGLARLTWARPDFRVGPVRPEPGAVFYSGGPAMRGSVARCCETLGLELVAESPGEEAGEARWRRLRSANVAVFDFTPQPTAADMAATAYDLGLARALGHPLVVITDGRLPLPFDVAVEPVALSGQPDDEAQLTKAIDTAVYSVPLDPVAGAGVVATARELIRHYGESAEIQGVPLLLNRLASRLDTPDAVDITSTLQTVLAEIGPDAGELIAPAWPAAYPDPGRPRLFHVMPFGPPWSKTVKSSIAELCAGAALYRRHDDVDDEHIIRSLWDEICRASHILVDLTGQNANVAVELGFAHALGKPTLVVAQPDTVAQLFGTIEKRRVHVYTLDRLDVLQRRVAHFLHMRVQPPQAEQAPQPQPQPVRRAMPQPPPPPPIPTRPGLLEIRRQFDLALGRDQRENGLAQVLTNALMMRGVVLQPGVVNQWVQMVRAYVASAPDLLEAVWRAACNNGIGDQVSPVLTRVEAYARDPNDVFPDYLGLIGVVDDAYLARQVVIGLHNQMTGTLPPASREQIEWAIRNEIIGEPFASQLDYMVSEILAGRDGLQTLRALTNTAAAQQAWAGAVNDYEIDRMVDVQLGAMGVI